MHSECHWYQDILACLVSLSCPTPLTTPLHLGWTGIFMLYEWAFKNDLDLLHDASSVLVFLFLEWTFWFSVLGSCLELWSSSSLPFCFLYFLVIFDYISGWSLKSAFILLLLEADLSILSLYSLAPQILHINMWMETLKFTTVPRKTSLQACLDGEFLLSNHLCFPRIAH